MRTLLICGSHLRHNVFANMASWDFEVAAFIRVTREDILPAPPAGLPNSLEELWETHFERRFASEARHFKGHEELLFSCDTLEITPEELNSHKVVEWLFYKGKFDCALIAGVPIIKNPLFSLLPQWRVNFHMGLIPWYKGSITMFWPQYFLKPHWAGCTYHVIAPEVDCGQIIHQTVPKLAQEDGLHDVASKAYNAACAEMPLVHEYLRKQVKLGKVPQLDHTLPKRGKNFLQADWRPEMLQMIYDLWDDNIAGAYLSGTISQSPSPKLIRLGDVQ